MINVRDQIVKNTTMSNLCALWKLDEEAANIEFYYDEVENVCLHLAKNLIEAK